MGGRKPKVARLVECGMTEDEAEQIKVRTARAEVLILEERAKQLALSNREKIIDLDTKTSQLTYIATALSEFSRGVSSFVTELRHFPDRMQNACNLTPDQYASVSEIVDEILQRLGRVEFHLESSSEIDAKASALQAKTKESGAKRESAVLAKQSTSTKTAKATKGAKKK